MDYNLRHMLVQAAADDLVAGVCSGGLEDGFLLRTVGWKKENIIGWMLDHNVCPACIANFQDNDSIYSPNDCVCSRTGAG